MIGKKWFDLRDKSVAHYEKSFNKSTGVKLYKTAAQMVCEGFNNDNAKEVLDYLFNTAMAAEDYKSAYLDDRGTWKFYGSCKPQRSVLKEGFSNTARILGLGTKPDISVTVEGMDEYWFPFVIFHELTHTVFETMDENLCNGIAENLNASFWGNK